MPIFEYCCKDCERTFESIEVWESHRATKCRYCGSIHIERLIGACHIRMNPDDVKHELPDPVPPLEELRGKGTHGYKDKPAVESDIRKGWEYTKDKYGNKQWKEKRRIHVDMGKDK